MSLTRGRRLYQKVGTFLNRKGPILHEQIVEHSSQVIEVEQNLCINSTGNTAMAFKGHVTVGPPCQFPSYFLHGQ